MNEYRWRTAAGLSAHMSHGMRNERAENAFLLIGMGNYCIRLPLRMLRMESRIRAGILLNRVSCLPLTNGLFVSFLHLNAHPVGM
jgi:hypothetical protein